MELNQFYRLFRDNECPRPRTFARRLILGKANLSECPQISAEQKSKIEAALKEGVEYTCAKCEFGSTSIIIRPCKAKGKTMGELRIGNKNELFPLFDTNTLFEIAQKEDKLDNISYSEELGFLRASMGEKNIFIFENGLIRVKQACDKKDVDETIEFIRGLIKKAEICELCGGIASECGQLYCAQKQ